MQKTIVAILLAAALVFGLTTTASAQPLNINKTTSKTTLVYTTKSGSLNIRIGYVKTVFLGTSRAAKYRVTWVRPNITPNSVGPNVSGVKMDLCGRIIHVGKIRDERRKYIQAPSTYCVSPIIDGVVNGPWIWDSRFWTMLRMQ